MAAASRLASGSTLRPAGLTLSLCAASALDSDLDIDDSLVRLAWKRRRTVWSQFRPPTTTSNSIDAAAERPGSGFERPTKRPKLALEHPVPELDQYPAAFEHMFGPLPIPPATPETEHTFPHNVSFRTANWPKNGVVEDKDGYDAVLACVSSPFSLFFSPVQSTLYLKHGLYSE